MDFKNHLRILLNRKVRELGRLYDTSFLAIDISSIHPFSSAYVRSVQWQQAEQGVPDIPVLIKAFHFLLGDHEVFPGQMG